MADIIQPFKIVTSSGEQVFPNVVNTTVEFGEYTNKIRIVISGAGVNYSYTPQFFNNYTFSGVELGTDAFNTYAFKDDVVVEKVYYNGTDWVAQLLLTLTNDLNSAQSIINETINSFNVATITPLGLGESWVVSSVELAHTENTYATKTVTGQSWVKADSFINCKIVGLTSADHTAEDAVLEGVQFDINNIVAGTGFDIVGHAPNGTYGKYSVRCFGY